MNQLIGIVFGVVFLISALLLRAGKGRDWWVPVSKKALSPSHSGFFKEERWVLIFLPALGLFFLSAGCLQLAVLPGGWVKLALLGLCGFGILVGFLGLIWGLFGIYYPEGVRPAWLREYYRQQGFAPDRGRLFAPSGSRSGRDK